MDLIVVSWIDIRMGRGIWAIGQCRRLRIFLHILHLVGVLSSLDVVVVIVEMMMMLLCCWMEEKNFVDWYE